MQCKDKTEIKDNSSIYQSKRLSGDSEVIWGLWLNTMPISLNKFIQLHFKIFSCNFGKYIYIYIYKSEMSGLFTFLQNLENNLSITHSV